MNTPDEQVETKAIASIIEKLPPLTFLVPPVGGLQLCYDLIVYMMNKKQFVSSDILPVSFRQPLQSALAEMLLPWDSDLDGVDIAFPQVSQEKIPHSDKVVGGLASMLEQLTTSYLGPEWLGQWAKKWMENSWRGNVRWLFWDCTHAEYATSLWKHFAPGESLFMQVQVPIHVTVSIPEDFPHKTMDLKSPRPTGAELLVALASALIDPPVAS